MLPHFRAAAFCVPLGPLEDSVHHNADVREGTRLGYGGMGATVHRLPQSRGVCGGISEGASVAPYPQYTSHFSSF
jgi:hypothetical protein